jgi:hypothetical protein
MSLTERSNLWLLIGFFSLLIVRFVIPKPDNVSVALMLLIVQIACECIFVYGCMLYAQTKGHHKLWGLLGFLNVFGLIIIWAIPRKK